MPNWRSFACVFHVFENYQRVCWGVCISPAPDHILLIRWCYEVNRACVSIKCHFKRWTQFSRRCTRWAVSFFVQCVHDHENRWQPTRNALSMDNARIIIIIISFWSVNNNANLCERNEVTTRSNSSGSHQSQPCGCRWSQQNQSFNLTL